MTTPQGGYPEPAQLVYSRATGQVLGRYRVFDVESGAYREAGGDEALALFGDRNTMARVTGTEDLAVLTVNLEPGARLSDLRVSTAEGTVESRPRILLRAERDAIEGNGEDSVELTVDIVDEQDTVVRDFGGEIKVTTTHGKLSERAGLVRAKAGRARLTLTSTRETIDQVRVRATAPDGTAQAAEITLSFE